MPKFSQESFSKLSTCHPDLQCLFYEVIKNFDCTIIEGYRNQADQEKDYAAGKTKLHYPEGKHDRQPSTAVDVMPYPVDWNNNHLSLWFGGYVMGIAQKLKDEGKMTHAIRWGGAWDGLGKLDTKAQLDDADHFELIL
jgi:peptidoglycan L-alanyl-D-glutamate endopeptidase CwlK